MGSESLAAVNAEVVHCRRCARLVAWREEVAATKRAAYTDEDYWGRPVPGFGDERATIVVMGLAPAAHGANRTGRMFTGDRSGDWLYAALHRAGLANQATSAGRDDGLRLDGVYITSPVKCAPPQNKPTTTERDECSQFLHRELDALGSVAVIVCLGQFAYQAMCRVFAVKPRPKFGHGVEVEAGTGTGPVLLCSYHVSQQNTFTGRLTTDMLDDVFRRARTLRG